MKREPARKDVISKSRFKPRALEYFRLVQETGKPIVIADRGKPVLKIVPYTEDPAEGLKALRGSVLEYDKPLDPVGIEDWESMK